MSLSKVIEIAKKELGVTENPPGSNRVKYWQDYDPKMQGQPWCVCFLWWVFQQAGERMAFFGGGKTASCSMLLRWYREQGLVVDVADIQVGDIVLLNFHGGKDPEHCGLVTAAGDYEGQTLVWTIEGNTSTAQKVNQDNGGIVAEKIRYGYQIVGVCRPQYQPEEPQIVPDYTGRWSQKYWEKGIALGIIDEAKDGKYRPKDNATREEVLAMIIRAREVKE